MVSWSICGLWYKFFGFSLNSRWTKQWFMRFYTQYCDYCPYRLGQRLRELKPISRNFWPCLCIWTSEYMNHLFSGRSLLYLSTLILLLVLRHSITLLRSLGLASILPLDNNIYLHKMVGSLIFFHAWFHTIMHLCNFGELSLIYRVHNHVAFGTKPYVSIRCQQKLVISLMSYPVLNFNLT